MMASAAPMDYGAPPDDEDLDDLLEQHYDDMEPPSFDEEDNMPEEGEDVMEPNAANPLPMSLGQIEEEETPEVEEAEDEEEEEEESGAASNPSSVRMQLARARSNQRDIFQFERYAIIYE